MQQDVCGEGAAAKTKGSVLGNVTVTATDGQPSSSSKHGASSTTSLLANGTADGQQLSLFDRNVIRLIGQHLRDLGLHRTVKELVRESGYDLEHVSAAQFRAHVLSGEWSKAIECDIEALKTCIDNPAKITEMQFILLEQCFLELLEQGEVVQALRVLREQLSPLRYNTKRLHQLSSFLMYNDPGELRTAAQWSGCGPVSRQKLLDRLQEFLPASVMLPPRRLEQLLGQAVSEQRGRCAYHNTRHDNAADADALLTDHRCSRGSFPSQTVQILSDHSDEVWFCAFNRSGTRMISASKDTTCILWSVDLSDDAAPRMRRKCQLEGHTHGAALAVFSPDDQHIAVVGQEDSCDVWVWNAETGELRQKITNSHDDSISCVSWFPNSHSFVCAGTKGQFLCCDIDGTITNSWEGFRIRALHARADGRSVLAADTHNRLRSYNFDETQDETLLKEDHSIMTFTVDSAERYALIVLNQQGLHLWDLVDRSCLRRFRGVTQGFYTIHSVFGGANEDFISSGSEDSNVIVWQRDREQPVISLGGHTSVVNAVAWHPTHTGLIVSASDDSTLRVWAPSGLCSAFGTTEEEEEVVSSTTRDRLLVD